MGIREVLGHMKVEITDSPTSDVGQKENLSIMSKPKREKAKRRPKPAPNRLPENNHQF